MSIQTALDQGFELGVIAWFNEFVEGIQLVPSDFCNNCVHPNGDKRVIRLCEKHWNEDKKNWAKLNDIKIY